MINVQPSAPHAALPRAAETSKPTQQKANDQPNPQTLESTPIQSRARPVLARSRRDLQNTDSPAVPRNASVRQFAEALIERGDSELAVGVGNSLIRQRLAGETRRPSEGQDEVTVPPDSTFGQLWSKLADALESEPFKSFAEAKLIVTSNLIIGVNGELSEKENGAIVNFFSQNDPEWAAASAAVLAAANKLTGVPRRELPFYGRDQAQARSIARFYGLELGNTDSNDTLSTAGQLLTAGRFSALSSADPLDAPVKQRQREAIQRIVDLPPQALTNILERFTPSTTQQKVQKADQELAQMVSRGLIKEVPEAGQYEMSVVLENIPEHSTFNLVRKNFLSALNGSAFKTFAQENDLEPTSIAINPVSGELTGKVKGVDTQFTLNDVSGWADAWSEIKDAVQKMPTGDDSLVTYPRHASAPLYQVMKFYNETLPHQESDTRQQNWEQRQLISSLGRVVEINRNNGFKALIDTGSSDSESAAVRQRQQAAIGQMENTPVSLSPLESLAAAVKANPGVTEQNAESPAEVLARAEKEMAIAVYRTMLELKADPTKAASTMMQSTPSSLFDLQKTYLKKASNSPGLAEYYQKNNFRRGSGIWIPPRDAAEQRSRAARTATQHPQYADLMMHQNAAAAPFSADGQTIQLNLADGNRVPFKWVFNFYGISTDPSSPKFAEQLERIGRTQQLSRTSENPQRVAHELHRQIMAVGDSNDRHALINTLVNGKIDQDDSASSMRFVVDPDSSHQPKGVKEARTFLAENHWYIPKSKAESDNLITALRTPIPQSPPLGNHWGFLSTDLPLSESQRSKVIAFVKHSFPGISLLSYLGVHVPQLDKDPEKALDQLLSTPKALEFATDLQAEMKGAVTPTSLKQWLLTALVLELDPTAGTQHKTVAGVDLMGVANAGYGSEVIRERFNRHMTAEKGVPAHLAPAAARVLMAGIAPQLLVSDVPKSVTLGSAQWFSFTEAVNRIEWTAPGATANMTYQQVMSYHNIQPISALEAQINSYAQMDPLLDWAAIHDGVNKDTYTLDQLKHSQKKLQAKMQAIGESKNWLRTHEAPNRRAMTLKVLREAFGTGIDYESRYMIESHGFGITGRHYSLAEIYEAGKLGDHWKQEGHHVDFERLRSKAKTLPVINTEFDKAINADFNLRRRHTVTLSKDMLESLPPEELNSIIYGTVELFNVDSNIKGAGRGMILFSKDKQGVTRTFAVPPPGGQMVRIADIDLDKIQLGKEVSLEIDTDAFKNGTAPRKGVRSNVIIRTTDMHLLDSNNQPWPLDISFPAHEENDRFSPDYAQRRIEKLASVIVDSTYLNQGEFTKLHRNWFSNTLETADEPSDFFKAVWHSLPGTSALEDIIEGKFLKAGVDLGIDVAIFIATDGLGELWNLAKSGARWAADKVAAKFIEKFGIKDALNPVIKDVTAVSVSESANSLSRMRGSPLPEPTGDMANGSLTRSNTKVEVTAVKEDGNWYFYNTKTLATEGPALEGFRSNTSIALKPQTLPDGKSVFVPDRLFTEDPVVINRSTYTDVKVGNKVYRYDPKHPDVLTDLASADHFNSTQDLEAFCPAGPRAKRGLDDVCFSKVVSDLSGTPAKLVQGLEHTRLYPSPAGAGKTSTIIYEHRIFDVVEKDGVYRTVQRNLKDPVDYLESTKGTLIKDPHFGLTDSSTLANLEQNTRIVKLDAISSLSNDKRELRGTIAVGPTSTGETARYVVVEADSFTYYYSKIDPDSTILNFKKIGDQPSLSELLLVTRHRNEIKKLLKLTGAPLQKEFVSLPTLESAFSELKAAGYTPVEVNDLKATIAPFSDEKKREFVYQLINRLNNSNGEVVLKAVGIEPLSKAGNFADLPVLQQNRFYADGAKEQIDAQVKATGIGSKNKHYSNDLNDLYRKEVSDVIVDWIRTFKVASPNYAGSVMKLGAGNCGEMAEAAAQIINKSGGRAKTWCVEGGDHAFTVVGGPPFAGKSTVGFLEDEWKDAWIVDPWAEISCKAPEYIGLLKKKMSEWSAKELEIYTDGDWRSPLYPKWITELTTLVKKPQ